MKTKCSRCKRTSVICLGYANLCLCKRHFIWMFEKKFRATVRQYKMIKKGEKIAVALSGGKDSTTLLHSLAGLREDFPFELVAITIDLGISCDYNRKILETARHETTRLKIPHYVYPLKEEIGCTLEELIKKTKTGNPCSYCGVIRRYILNKKARALGARKLAIGHTLDDSAQTAIMGIIRNEPLRLLRKENSCNAFVPRIKPFTWLSEQEVVTYGKLKGLKLEEKKCCPYSKNAMRALVRVELDELEEVYPGTKMRIMKSTMKMRELLREDINGGGIKASKCKKCGEPSAEQECMYCRMTSVESRGVQKAVAHSRY